MALIKARQSLGIFEDDIAEVYSIYLSLCLLCTVAKFRVTVLFQYTPACNGPFLLHAVLDSDGSMCWGLLLFQHSLSSLGSICCLGEDLRRDTSQREELAAGTALQCQGVRLVELVQFGS